MAAAGSSRRGGCQYGDIRISAGATTVTVPSPIFLELLNVAGRRWGWDADALAQLATALEDLGFDVAEAELAAIAEWTSRGLTAYDASYVALAESRGLRLVTDDDRILSVASGMAQALACIRERAARGGTRGALVSRYATAGSGVDTDPLPSRWRLCRCRCPTARHQREKLRLRLRQIAANEPGTGVLSYRYRR